VNCERVVGGEPGRAGRVFSSRSAKRGPPRGRGPIGAQRGRTESVRAGSAGEALSSTRSEMHFFAAWGRRHPITRGVWCNSFCSLGGGGGIGPLSGLQDDLLAVLPLVQDHSGSGTFSTRTFRLPSQQAALMTRLAGMPRPTAPGRPAAAPNAGRDGCWHRSAPLHRPPASA